MPVAAPANADGTLPDDATKNDQLHRNAVGARLAKARMQ
jgi:hypothetical protein